MYAVRVAPVTLLARVDHEAGAAVLVQDLGDACRFFTSTASTPEGRFTFADRYVLTAWVGAPTAVLDAPREGRLVEMAKGAICERGGGSLLCTWNEALRRCADLCCKSGASGCSAGGNEARLRACSRRDSADP